MKGRTEGRTRSVHDRLIRHARSEGLDPTLVLARYGLERFLHRLSCSEHAGRFILKGAFLLVAWLGETARATRDADFLGLGELSDDVLLEVMRDVCRTDIDDDGMVFDPASVRLAAIRAGDPYGGRRVSLQGGLGAGRIPVQIDVGMGDAVVPEAEWLDLPALLDAPAPRLRAYRPETVVAEKLHAIVHLGLANTRLKDFYDLLVLSRTRSFHGETLQSAVAATFERRRTDLPTIVPPGLTADFASDARRRQWSAFVTRNDLPETPELADALEEVRLFVGPVTRMQSVRSLGIMWTPGDGWVEDVEV